MRFGEPWALLGLLLVPLVFVIRSAWLAHRKRQLDAAGEVALFEALTDDAPRVARARATQAALFAVGLGFTCLALARPQYGLRTEVRQGRGMDVVVALDLSRSMYARDVVPSRLERAKIEIGVLLDRLRGDRVGLVGFTSVGLPLCPLTVDHAALRIQLAGAEPGDLPRGGTSVASAIRAALRMLEAAGHPEADRAIVILTDGEAHQGDPAAAAEEAKKAGVEVHVAGVGSRVGEPIPIVDSHGRVSSYVKDKAGKTVVSRLDEDTLGKIAAAGGGQAALPSAEGGLDLGRIARRLSSLRKADLEARTVRVFEERYTWALAPAFLFLLLATLVRPTRRSALPRLVLGLPLLFLPGRASAQDFLQRNHPEVQRGLDALSEGRAEDAKKAFSAAEEALGRDPRLTYDAALADAARGELDQAMEGFRAAAEASDDANLRARARVGLGNALRKLKKYDDAAAAYRDALLEDPSVDAARRNLEIAQRMKAVQAAQPPSDNEGEDGEQGDEGEDGQSNDEESDGEDGADAGVPDASESGDGGSAQDSGGEDERGDGGTSPDGGGSPEDGDAGTDGGASNGGADDGPDAGVSDGASDSRGQDAGDRGDDGVPDGGATSGARRPDEGEAPDLSRQEAEAILDALQAEEKALERKRLIERFKGRPVEKDW